MPNFNLVILLLDADNQPAVIMRKGRRSTLAELARPERFELPTTKFVAWYSIQMSYGREEAELFRQERV